MFHRHTWTKWARKRVTQTFLNGRSYEADIQERTCTSCGKIQAENIYY